MGSTRAPGWDVVAAFAERRLAGTYGAPVTASGVALHPSKDLVAATADVRPSLLEPNKAVVTLFEQGRVTAVREGWAPAWSPDGATLAHLDATGVQLGELHRDVEGTVERLAWKADSSALLLVVADPRSELSGVNGSGISPAPDEDWTPSVVSNVEHRAWRRLAVLDATSGALALVGRPGLNAWNACWAGEQVLAVCSDGSPTESAWYAADLRLIDPVTGEDRVVARPDAQIGAISASPSGRRLAYVESIASDRDLVAGDLLLLDPDSGATRRLAAPTDVSDVAFVSEDELGFAGLEGLVTRVGLARVDGSVQVLWEALETTAAGFNPEASFRPGAAAFLRVGEGTRPEVLLATGAGEPAVLASLLEEGAEAVRCPGTTRPHRWRATDGLEIEGLLQLPEQPGPHPLVVLVHGGPVHSARASWSPLAMLRPLLLERGYAVLMPNVRGSSGRGQEFARAVVGDMGGADAQDVLSGVRSLVEAGLVDEQRVGLTGGSYGGFLTAWLVTQTDLFAAAVAQYPITDWAHQHGCSSIPGWDELFLDGKPYAKDGQYVERSPMTHVDRVTTPTLFVVGTLDRATPAGQALMMQRALEAHGVPSECVTYPTAAHGAKDMPSVIDSTARILAWFERWMPARPDHEES